VRSCSAEIGLSLLPAVVNSCWTDRPGLEKSPAMAARSHKITLSASAKSALASSADFGRERLQRQRHQIARLADGIGVPLVTLPRLATPRLTLHHLGELADALVGPTIGGTP
jgi:arsenite/tail-anchored protein-transporting ATPase